MSGIKMTFIGTLLVGHYARERVGKEHRAKYGIVGIGRPIKLSKGDYVLTWASLLS